MFLTLNKFKREWGDFAMTTAQLTGELKMGSCTGGAWGLEKREGRGGRREVAARAGAAAERPVFRTLTGAVLEALEREDTVFDRMAGYGICGLSFFYLAAQVVRSIW